jgi:conjugal transfer/type IV secretion protein DotA/TraY
MQSASGVTQIMSAASSPTDVASSFFRFILGTFWDNPLSAIAGGSIGLFGAMFAIYNAVIFVVGVFWASYGIGAAVADTAQSGEALGKRVSLVWMPIRMVTGIAGIVPVFGGFSLSQVVLVVMATIGIGAANLMTNAAVDASASFQTIMSPAAAVGTSDKVDFKELADSLFKGYVCQLAYKNQASDPAINYEPLPGDDIAFMMTAASGQAADAGDSDTVQTYQLGSQNNPLLCGGYKITYVGAPSGSSTFGFRVGSVNYGAYTSNLKSAAQTSAKAGMDALNGQVQQIAQAWYAARHGSASPTSVPYPIAQLSAAAEAARQARVTQLQSAVDTALAQADGTGGAIAAAVVENMKAQGFAGVGAWYSTFAEASAAYTSALDSVKVTPIGVDDWALFNSGVADDLQSITKASDEISSASSQSNDDSILMSWLCKRAGWVRPTDTGDCSLGQAAVRRSIDQAKGSGGGNLINPIVMFKNLGDGVLDMAGAMTTVVATTAVVTNAAPDGLVGRAAAVAAKLPGVGIVAKLAKVAAGIAWVIPYLVAVGLLLSIYIPMIPVITWMGGITQYVVIFCQGIVGMPIAAFAHLDAEGDGMGRRTEAGYMFVLNVTFRPALMLFGFFMASGLMLVLGTFQASLFVTAMANAQGNSITGLFSFLGFLLLFAVMNVTMIQSLFNMVFLLPDQVLSLVGNHGHMADLGKDAEHKIHALFTSTGRSAQSAVAELGRGKPKPPGNGRKPPSDESGTESKN